MINAHPLCKSELQKNIFLLGTSAKIVGEMKVLFTIAYIQYRRLQLYLLKRFIVKVMESGFQAIKVLVMFKNE